MRESDAGSPDDRIYGPFESLLLLNAAERCGVAGRDVLEGSGLKPRQLSNATTRLSARQRLGIYRNVVERCPDGTVFLRAGNSATVCSFGVWGYVLMTSNTYLDSVTTAFKYLKLTGPLLEKTFDVRDGTALFEARDHMLLGPLLQPVVDFWFAFTVRLSKEVTRGEFELGYIELSFPRPAHGDFYESLFGCPVRFGAGRNRLGFDAANLGIPLPRADILAFQVCDRLCASMLEEMKVASGPAREVRDMLLSAPGDFPSLSDIAERLYTTPRTLRRRLAEQGTSYQQILNDVRKGLALKFLRETRLSMEEIAERVGFSDSRNFRHAFKKWTDSTPSSHRVHP